MATLLARAPSAFRSAVTQTREAVVAGLDDPNTYPVLSEAAVRAMEVVNGKDIPIAQLAAIIRPDAFVTAAVIRTANSAKYRGRTLVDSVPGAILRIGLRECGQLISTVGMQSMYHRLDPAARKGCETLHRHSVFVASLAGGLNKLFGLGQGTAFTAGLLHDVGRMILCGKMPGRFRDTDRFEHQEDADLIRRERDAFGIDHPAVGYRFAMKHGLPEPVVRAILNHHRADEERHHPVLVGLVGTADLIANYVQREHRVAAIDLAAEPAFETLTARWPATQVAGFGKFLPEVVKAAIRETRGMLKSAGGGSNPGVR